MKLSDKEQIRNLKKVVKNLKLSLWALEKLYEIQHQKLDLLKDQDHYYDDSDGLRQRIIDNLHRELGNMSRLLELQASCSQCGIRGQLLYCIACHDTDKIKEMCEMRNTLKQNIQNRDKS